MTQTEVRPYRILVTGSRTTTPAEDVHIRAQLRRVCAPHIAAKRRVVIVEGDCPYGGVDITAREFARNTPYAAFESHPVEWHRDGRAAGPLRNQRMVDTSPDICLAFPSPDSEDTWDCVRRAAAAGINCEIYPIGVARP